MMYSIDFDHKRRVRFRVAGSAGLLTLASVSMRAASHKRFLKLFRAHRATTVHIDAEVKEQAAVYTAIVSAMHHYKQEVGHNGNA